MNEQEGTKVTAVDLKTGEEESTVIKDNYVLTTDGDCYLDGYQAYKNGTVVLTIKRGKP